MRVVAHPEFSMPRAFLAPMAMLVLMLSGAAAAAQTTVPPIDFHERVLPNGLKVITSLDRTTPNVTVQVWYGVGAKNDPHGRSGFAHMFEHMMFKATRDMPAEYMDRLTEDVGGMNNAFTQDDTTAFYEVIPAADLQRLIWAEARADVDAGGRQGQLQLRAAGGRGGAAPAGARQPLRAALLLRPAGGQLRASTRTTARRSARSRTWTPPPSTTCRTSTPPSTAPTTRRWWWPATSTPPS